MAWTFGLEKIWRPEVGEGLSLGVVGSPLALMDLGISVSPKAVRIGRQKKKNQKEKYRYIIILYFSIFYINIFLKKFIEENFE